MTSLQKLCRQLASTSKSLKLGVQPVVSSLLRGASYKQYPILSKRRLSCQHGENLCPDTVDFIQRPPDEISRNATSQISNKSIFSPIICPHSNRFVEDSKDMIQIRNNLWDENFRQTSYFFHKGFRHVYPYYYTYRSFVKKHWVGLSIENAYTSTFYAVHDQNWVERDIAAGLIRVNGNRPTKDYVLKFGDALEHMVHRHEMPVSDFKVDILHYDSNIIVVNKPPSLAIHPTGRYQHNTLIYILAREYNMRDAYIIHRLDKGTSGVFLLGRNKSTASFFSQENANRKTCKTYVARVIGKFPGTIECEEAITPLDYKTRIMKVCKTGKPSKTVFEIMSYNPKTNRSIVLCRPYTGRTHQIRVHLQYLGFPIDNDPIYNSPMFGENRGKGGVLECSQEILRAYESTRSRWAPLEHATSRDIVCEPWLTMAKGPFVDQARAAIDNECELCPLPLLIAKDDFGFHLHALEFKGEGWSFSSPLPEWADSEWEEMGTPAASATATT